MRRQLTLCASALLALAPTPGMTQTAPVPVRDLSFDEALAVATAAVKAARDRRRPSAIVIANQEGRILVAMRMDGVSFMNLDVAETKAATAAALGAPTDAIEQAVDGGKTSLLAVPGLGTIGGGIPIRRGGNTIAGIGVSGGTPVEDKAIAEAAIASARSLGLEP